MLDRRRMRPIALTSLLVLAACGGAADRVSIRGDFADSASAPTLVRAVEAEREAEVKGGAFELPDLSAGPVTLRLVRGTDTAGTLALDNAPAGAAVVLHDLRTDARSGRAFPRAVELTGAELLVVNGVRMASDARIPADVDAHGAVLALAEERDAFLFRPDDASLPDLRVVVGLGTEAVTPDGDPADLASLARGDSVRVKGRADRGFVVAERLTLSRRAALGAAPAAPAEETDDASAAAAPSDAEPIAASAPPARVAPARVLRGRGDGRARGEGRGRGQAKGKKKG